MEYQTEPVTMWFDRRLVMRSSTIHGIGTFATHAIRAGERLIWVSGGIVYSGEDWRTGRVQLAVNHSCDPKMLNDVAWRDIEAGEEITTDYAYCEASPSYRLEPCRCGSAFCRGRMTGNDWKLPELQQRYSGYFTPHIEHLIRASSARTND